MKYKWFFIFLGILLVLVIFLLVQISFEKKSPYVTPFANKQVNGIKIVKKDMTIRIKKINDNWEITQPIKYKASKSIMKDLEKKLQNFKIEETITKDKNKFSLFHVEDTEPKLWFYYDNDSLGFILGKSAGAGLYYLRYIGGNKVFISSDLPYWRFDQKLSDWREKKFLTFEKDSLDSLILSMGINKKRIKKDKTNNWILNNKPIDKNKVEPILNQLQNFSCDDFLDTLKTFKEKIGIKIYLKGGVKHHILIGETINKNYPLKLDSNPTIFLINQYKANLFLKLFK